MGLLTWLRRTIFYLRSRSYFLFVNTFVRAFVRKHRRSLDLSNVSRLTIAGPSGGRIALYLHSPPNDVKGPKPVHINIHGGGFCMDAFGIDARFCQLVCKTLGCYVVDADYRMAPAYPWPAAYDDSVRVLDWVRANEGGLFDTERITMGGFSAGANLTLAVAGTAEEGVLKGLVAFYPATDFTIPYAKKAAPPLLKLEGRDKGLVIPIPMGVGFRNAYLRGLPDQPDPETLKDPRLSPLFAPLSKFPDKGRTMVLSCEYDYLDAEGRAFAQALEDAGREPVRVWVKGLGHGWDGMCKDGSEGAKVRDEMWGKAVEVIRRAQGVEGV